MDDVMSRSLSTISRREDRIFVTLPVTLRCATEDGSVVHGNTVDFSDRGLRVRANSPFHVKQNIEVIVAHNGHEPRNYDVKWVRGQGNGQITYEVGLERQV
jgi:PilZ domain